MDYSKKGIKRKQREINAFGSKVARKIVFTCVQLLLAAIVGVGICGAAGGIGLFKSILAGTPTIHIGDVGATGQATMVFDCYGNKIDEYVGMDSNRIVVGWDKIPRELGYAFVAIEDERFYQNNGVDFKALVRAGYQFLKTGQTQGGSTITQQLLKNTIFTEWTEEGHNMIKKIKRKVQEQYLAIEISKVIPKDEILLRYMNVINLGQNTLGVESASQRYFGKSALDLSISECAVIASVTQNPSGYNPISHPDDNVKRAETCLKKMKELEFITSAEYDEAYEDVHSGAVYDRISFHNTELAESNAGSATYFSDSVYEQVLKDLIDAGYDKTNAQRLLTSGGLRIYTTLVPELQAIMDEEFQNPDNFPEDTNWYLDYALTIYDKNKEPHNFSKENMMTWFTENNVSADHRNFYFRDRKTDVRKFNLVFYSQEDAYEAIDFYREAMFESLGVTPSDDNYDERISMTPQPQTAMVLEDQSTGYVVALVGGRGVKEGRRTLNRATDAKRSPGSTFKVLASFAPALDAAGRTLATVYNDAYFTYADGTPVKNWYSGYNRGICSLRYATEQSLNVIAVKNLTCIGPRLGYDYCVNFGFTTLTDGVWIGNQMYTDVQQPLALGGLTYGVTPFELNAAYAAIANGGVYNKPKLYTRVTDPDGNVILDNTVPDSHRVLKETTAWLLIDAMKDVVNGGTGSRAKFPGMTMAGKTGTSTDYWDLWFVGFTPYYTAAVWNGYDNNIKQNSDEQAIAKQLWKAVMSRVHENLEDKDFYKPDGIVQVQVCALSGLLPNEGLCDGHVKTEYFAVGTEPEEHCTVHFHGVICRYDGKIACAGCPFAQESSVTLPLLEEPALLSGSRALVTNPDGTTYYTEAAADNYCQHNASFYAQPNYEEILAMQQAQLDAAQAALEQAAAEAAAAAEQGTP
ncbi:MAG: transglycosylase domain-containing protein [Lachnospiraceae bacterium]|nr:transglycosylase domain-containing protein [Lachnospiraceae bacterium]